MPRKFQFIFPFVVLAALACSKPDPSKIPNPPGPANNAPNVLVILVDTLRADHLGCYGYSRNTSPNIDKLAAEGVQFEKAFSASSYTRESVAALFSGKFPSSNPWGSGWLACPDPDAPSLAGVFKDNGYQTAIFYNNPVISDKVFLQHFEHHVMLKGDVSMSGAEDRLSLEALKHLDSLPLDSPFMFYVHYLDPHAPYAPADYFYYRFAKEKFPNPIPLVPEVRGKLTELVAEGFGPGEPRFDDLVLRYDAEIGVTDEAIGILIDGLKERGLDQNTIVVLLSDHGEEFLEHGFVEHCWDLRKESIHVPLIFWMPDTIKPERVSSPVSTVNLFPTLAKMADLEVPPGLDGYSLHEDGAWHVEERPIFAELLIQSRVMMRMALLGDYAYFAAPKWLDIAEKSAVSLVHQEILKEFQTGARPFSPTWKTPEKEFLYNIKLDPAQQSDLIKERPDIAAQYCEILSEYQAKCPAPMSEHEQRTRTEFGLSPDMEEMLRALGYLSDEGATKKKEAPVGVTDASDEARNSDICQSHAED